MESLVSVSLPLAVSTSVSTIDEQRCGRQLWYVLGLLVAFMYLSFHCQVAKQASIREPPNHAEFDSVVEGRLAIPRARGRLGPRTLSNENLPPQPSVDSNTLLAMAILPALTNLTQQQRCNHSLLPQQAIPTPGPSTYAPDPKACEQLHRCLEDFKEQKGIDFTMFVDDLARLDYTPDIIPEVDIGALRDITKGVNGQILKFRVFCRDWKLE